MAAYAEGLGILRDANIGRRQHEIDAETTPLRERLTKLFEFLKAYTDLRFPPVRDIAQQPRSFWLKNLPLHSLVELFRDVGKSEEEIEDNDIVLRSMRPVIRSAHHRPQCWQNG